ncbi:MAG: hypothetical protein KKC58_05810, partial [Gammaproteobacteria bacterium]|nr:hypothetical protein [Gammaproteobacteria bacterium]
MAASYLQGRPESVTERRSTYQGAVTATLSYPMLMQDAVRRSRAANFDLWLFDLGTERRLVFSDLATPGPAHFPNALKDFKLLEGDAVLSVIS